MDMRKDWYKADCLYEGQNGFREGQYLDLRKVENKYYCLHDGQLRLKSDNFWSL